MGYFTTPTLGMLSEGHVWYKIAKLTVDARPSPDVETSDFQVTVMDRQAHFYRIRARRTHKTLVQSYQTFETPEL